MVAKSVKSGSASRYMPNAHSATSDKPRSITSTFHEDTSCRHTADESRSERPGVIRSITVARLTSRPVRCMLTTMIAITSVVPTAEVEAHTSGSPPPSDEELVPKSMLAGTDGHFGLVRVSMTRQHLKLKGQGKRSRVYDGFSLVVHKSVRQDRTKSIEIGQSIPTPRVIGGIWTNENQAGHSQMTDAADVKVK